MFDYYDETGLRIELIPGDGRRRKKVDSRKKAEA
jgi:hypothetical protein